MDVKIEAGWKKELNNEFDQAYFIKLTDFVRHQYQTKQIFPPAKLMFNAFEQTPFDAVKVVILGQDPYHNVGQAHGMSFSVNDGIQLPPSLINIFKELHDDMGTSVSQSGNLTKWAKQGVLLLNATLTVEAHKAGSHQNQGWEIFTDAAIRKLSEKRENIVFILWGSYAQKKQILIDQSRHFIIKSAHPSPLSSYRGFFGSKPFSKTNNYLISKNIVPINW